MTTTHTEAPGAEVTRHRMDEALGIVSGLVWDVVQTNEATFRDEEIERELSKAHDAIQRARRLALDEEGSE